MPAQKLLSLLVIFWVVIISLNLLAFWFAPADYRLYVGIGAAVVTFILVWFMPGLNPVWSAKSGTYSGDDSGDETMTFDRVDIDG